MLGTRQMMDALRAAKKLPLLSATEARSSLPGPAFAAPAVAVLREARAGG